MGCQGQVVKVLVLLYLCTLRPFSLTPRPMTLTLSVQLKTQETINSFDSSNYFQHSPKKAKMEFVMHRTERKVEKSPTKPKESPTKPEKNTPPKKTPEKGNTKTGSAEKKISPAKTDSHVSIYILDL